MTWFELSYNIQHFLQTGGFALWLIVVVMALLWLLIVERQLFIRFTFPKLKQTWEQDWQQQPHNSHWQTQRLRELTLSQASLLLKRGLPTIKVLVAMCPLLGLLGTVDGMINVFETMKVLGTANPRAMASGISQATLTTMAGMVVALPGLFFYNQLQHQIDRACRQLRDRLTE